MLAVRPSCSVIVLGGDSPLLGQPLRFTGGEIALEPGALHRVRNAVLTPDETMSLEQLEITANGLHGHPKILRGACYSDAALGAGVREQVAPALMTRSGVHIPSRHGLGCGDADRAVGLRSEIHVAILVQNSSSPAHGIASRNGGDRALGGVVAR